MSRRQNLSQLGRTRRHCASHRAGASGGGPVAERNKKICFNKYELVTNDTTLLVQHYVKMRYRPSSDANVHTITHILLIPSIFCFFFFVWLTRALNLERWNCWLGRSVVFLCNFETKTPNLDIYSAKTGY